MMRFLIPAWILLLLLPVRISGQPSIPDTLSPESRFARMQALAAEEEYGQAKAIGRALHRDYPAYHDASLFLARIYGWEGNYDSAYMLVDSVLVADPGLLEAYGVGVDAAYWDNDWQRLETYASEALRIDPDNGEIQGKYRLARYRLALLEDPLELYLLYTYDHFREPYIRNWHMVTAGARIPFRAGSVLPYINAGTLAGVPAPSTDLQGNLDTYVALGPKNYALAGYGFSPGTPTDYLPRHRAAAELWQVLPAGFAVSGGGRYFYWDRHFVFPTVSVEKYVGNYWFSLRNYLFFKEYGVSSSHYLSARRYFTDRYDHLTVTLGTGTAPDEPFLVASDLDRLNAWSVRAELSRRVRHNLRLLVSSGYAYEEYSAGLRRHRVTIRAGFYFMLIR